MNDDVAKTARIEERNRCEKIIQSYMKKYKDDLVRLTLLKNLLARVRRK